MHQHPSSRVNLSEKPKVTNWDRAIDLLLVDCWTANQIVFVPKPHQRIVLHHYDSTGPGNPKTKLHVRLQPNVRTSPRLLSCSQEFHESRGRERTFWRIPGSPSGLQTTPEPWTRYVREAQSTSPEGGNLDSAEITHSTFISSEIQVRYKHRWETRRETTVGEDKQQKQGF